MKRLLEIVSIPGQVEPIISTPEGVASLDDLPLLQLKDQLQRLLEEVDLELMHRRL